MLSKKVMVPIICIAVMAMIIAMTLMSTEPHCC
jgi:hypothetical protein